MASSSFSAPASRLAAAAAGDSPAFSPLYQQIKKLILHSLEGGEWKPGEAIPSEIELAARYRVSQGTVRKAIDELAKQYLLVRRQGKGTFVATHAERHVSYRFLRLTPDLGEPQSEGPALRRFLDCKRLRAPADIAQSLQLRSGDAVLYVRRTLEFSQRVIIVEEMWLPGNAFKGLTVARLARNDAPMYAMFEAEFAIRMVRAEEKIKAVAADAEHARLLGVNEKTPLLSVERVAYTYNNVPMELRRGVYCTDNHHYRNQLN
jgi:GntR family transcriptional regulator